MGKIVFLLVYREENSISISDLQKYPARLIRLITLMVVDDQLKSWLECNGRDVKVDSYPSFLIATDEETKVYPFDQIDTVLNMIKKLVD